MNRPVEPPGFDRPEAERVYAEFYARCEDGENPDIEALCAEHPDCAEELRELHAHVLKARGLLGRHAASTRLSQRILALFGPEADPRIALEREADDEPTFSSELVRRLAARETSFGRYRIKGELARGGMGAVLRVWDEDLRRHLAMKVVLGKADPEAEGDTPAIDARSLGRFLEEAQVTGQLDHPGIVPIHELGVDPDGQCFFTMKLVRGRNLQRIIDEVHAGEGGWTLTRALGVVLKVCQAMAYAHDKDVLHRDLKPSNVMVGRFGEVYVMDWGLARVLGQKDTKNIRIRSREDGQTLAVESDRRVFGDSTPDSPLITMDGDIIGTPAYMSPEQASGRLEELGPPSDVYSVGAILYHLLTGHSPYVAEGERVSGHTVLAMVLMGPPPPLHSAAREVPPELAAICDKAMARKAADRYPGTLALAEDLQAYLEGRVVRAWRSGPWIEARKWVRRNRPLAAAAAAALLLALGGLGSTAYVQSTGHRRLADTNRRLREANAKASAMAMEASARAREAAESAALAEEREAKVLRLSDALQLRELVAEANELWPPHPDQVDDFQDWLDRAFELEEHLPQHEATLAAMRETGSPVTAEPDTWRFERTEDQWHHDTLSELVGGLESFFEEGTGLESSVEERLEFARSIRAKSLTDPEPARRWEEAIDSIANADECPRYRDLVIRPQIGLLPIGCDPASGLWEFAHLQSGEPPVRNQGGGLALAEETGIVLVLLPGGRVSLGTQSGDRSLPNWDPQAEPSEGPVYEVELEPFLLSKYEMTQAQWLRIARSTPSTYRKDGPWVSETFRSLLHPVETVSWDDCTETLQRMALRLPTEAQWEYACRAGTTTPFWTGAEVETLQGAVNLADLTSYTYGARFPRDWEGLDDGWPVHAPVGSLPANAFGLHEIVGNVWEWCLDPWGHHDEPRREGDGLRSVDPEGRDIAIRGAGFNSPTRYARSAYREPLRSANLGAQAGVRPARPLDR